MIGTTFPLCRKSNPAYYSTVPTSIKIKVILKVMVFPATNLFIIWKMMILMKTMLNPKNWRAEVPSKRELQRLRINRMIWVSKLERISRKKFKDIILMTQLVRH